MKTIAPILKDGGVSSRHLPNKSACVPVSTSSRIKMFSSSKMVLGENEQNDDAEIERYCYNNDTTKCDEFGGLYQWAEMMRLPSRCNTESCSNLIKPNHQGICPEGWRLFTYNDYRIVRFSEGYEEHGVDGLRSGYRFSGYNTTGFSLVGAGKREKMVSLVDWKKLLIGFIR